MRHRRHAIHFSTFALLIGMLGPAASTSRAQGADGSSPAMSRLSVVQYLSPRGESDLVMIGGKPTERLLVDDLLEAYRQADVVAGNQDAWIPTGTMKVISVQGAVAIARVQTAATDIGRTVFPMHPEVMAGDLVEPKRVTISPIQTVLQEATVLYRDLFVDPKGRPSTFELTDTGRARLAQMAVDLAKAHVSVLMIEAFTDKNGNSDANQIESYERALTVRQFLIHDMGFDEAKVVAVGYGETEQVKDNAVAGYRERNRRVVLKVLAKG